MKLSIDIKVPSPSGWIETVMSDFDAFLQDHADCERKASSMAMSFVAKYPDRTEIIPELIETALEELEHFQQVYEIMEKRGVQLKKEMSQDIYIHQLLNLCRTGREERFMDRMLLASVVECRGAERFRLVYEAQQDQELKKFYHNLWASEAKHGNLFVKLLMHYFDEQELYDRLEYLMEEEGKIILNLPLKAALH